MFRGATTSSVSPFLRGWRCSFEDARVKLILDTLVLGLSVPTSFVSDGIYANIRVYLPREKDDDGEEEEQKGKEGKIRKEDTGNR